MGVPLDPSTRSFMESRFGVALGDVRVHAGAGAAAAARALNARAFTFGPHIVFGDQQYEPQSIEGQRLLAHELVHVIQQRGASGATNHARCSIVGDPRHPLEAEAERVAEEVLGRGQISSIHRDMAPAVRRVIRVDPASATMSVDAGVSKAKPAITIIATGPNVADKVALSHLTQGVNPALVVVSRERGIDDPVIKMAGKLDVVLEPGDDATLPGFRFGFIQIGEVFVLEDTYVGRTLNEGHVKLQHRLKVSPLVLLDSDNAFFPFSNRVGTFFSPVQESFRRRVTVAVDLGILPGKTGDSPVSKSKAVITNVATSAENFLFESRTDSWVHDSACCHRPSKEDSGSCPRQLAPGVALPVQVERGPESNRHRHTDHRSSRCGTGQQALSSRNQSRCSRARHDADSAAFQRRHDGRQARHRNCLEPAPESRRQFFPARGSSLRLLHLTLDHIEELIRLSSSCSGSSSTFALEHETAILSSIRRKADRVRVERLSAALVSST